MNFRDVKKKNCTTYTFEACEEWQCIRIESQLDRQTDSVKEAQNILFF